MAVSQLLHAEVAHLNAFLSNENEFSMYPTRSEMISFQDSIGKLFEALNEKQRLHIKMIEASQKIFKQGEEFE